jgi:NAD(P)-dependent dehydrogenase (short-subunit alcohol dehydrogenase family)
MFFAILIYMKTVLITGVSRGIGKAIAQKFLANGDFVIGTSTDGHADWSDNNLLVFPLDLSNPESIKNCAEKIQGLGKTIDLLINNAGTWIEKDEGPIIYPDVLRQTLEVNLIGPIDFTQQLLPLLSKNVHIINISSRQGSLQYSHNSSEPSYKISKAGLNMFTRILAFRQGDAAIVSAVHPGWVKTDMGGDEAEIEPAEAAEDIFKLAYSEVESGQFWFKGEKFPW